MKTIQMTLEEYKEDLQNSKEEALRLVPDFIVTIETILKLSHTGYGSEFHSAIIKLAALWQDLKAVKVPGDF